MHRDSRLEKFRLRETLDIARFATNLKFDHLPTEVIEKAKHCIMDTIGCSLVGIAVTDHAKILVELIKELEGKPEATIIGDGFRTTAVNAALANGTSAHSLDLDDAHRESFFHVGVGSIPSVLALAEKKSCNGKEIITAIMAAFEVSIRLALAVNPSLRLRGFHTTGTCGTFGGAIGAGKILGLDEEQMVSALGHAGTQAAGVIQFFDDGDMSKRILPGKAAANGIFAALLAQRGYVGPYRILEGRYGFPAVLAGEYKPEVMCEGLGEKFRIMDVGLKIHAACRYAHTPIDAALLLATKYRIKPKDVQGGEIRACKISVDQLKKQDVSTLLDGQMSGPFGVALAIAHGKAGYKDFHQGIREQTVLNLAGKIKMVEDPQLGLKDRTAVVKITTKDGRTYSQEVTLAKGEPEVPLTSEEIEGKFMELASTALDTEKVKSALQLLNDLENVKDISELVKSLVP
jgi:2-methylcitrate dehydratase PrpD